MGSQQESSAWPGTRRATADSIAVRVYLLKTNTSHMAFAAHQRWTQGGGGPLTQNHVTTPSIMIARHATAIIPSRVIFVAQKQKTPAGAFPQESLVSPRETVLGGLHPARFFHPTPRHRQVQADLDRRAECSGSVAKAAQSAPLEPTIPL